MKLLKITFLSLLVGLMTSCRNDNGGSSDTPQALEVKTVNNLHAKQTSDYTTNPPSVSGEFVKFSFDLGTTTTSETDWDIAFRGTTILVNGGEATGLSSEPVRNGNAAAYIANGTFNDITTVNTSLFKQDSAQGLSIPTGSENGWYLYTGSPEHLIKPIAGKILVCRTHNGKYAKVEISSYYKNDDTSDYANAQYYSFNYVYQPTDSTEF